MCLITPCSFLINSDTKVHQVDPLLQQTALPLCCCLQVGEFKTPLRDGWGITVDEEGLMVLSDGSDTLTWVDPEDGFKRVRSVAVRDGTRRVPLLNEVCVEGLGGCLGCMGMRGCACGSSHEVGGDGQ
jgi:hypothetical protein